MTSYFTDKLEIEIPGAADLSHRRSWLSSADAFFNIVPMEPDADRYPHRTADYGAAFSLVVPEAFILNCFRRRKTHYHLEGDSIGSMSEVHNAEARDGSKSHSVGQFTFDWWVDKADDRYGFAVEGKLNPIPKTFDARFPPRPLHEFHVSATLLLDDAHRLFKDETGASAKIEEALQQWD